MLIGGIVLAVVGAVLGSVLMAQVEWCRDNLGMLFSILMGIYIMVPVIMIFRTCTIAGFCSSNTGTGLNRPPVPNVRVVAYAAKSDGSAGELLYSTFTDGGGNFTFSRMRNGEYVVAAGIATVQSEKMKADFSLRGGTQLKELIFEPGTEPPALSSKDRVHGQDPTNDTYETTWGGGNIAAPGAYR